MIFYTNLTYSPGHLVLQGGGKSGRKLVRLGPDKVRGVALGSKWGQDRAIRDQTRAKIVKIVTNK